MHDQQASWKAPHQFCGYTIRPVSLIGCVILLWVLLCLTVFAHAAEAQEGPREQHIPVLGVKQGDNPTGTITYVMVLFAMRDDVGGLEVNFLTGPGRFTQATQTAMVQAIARTARVLGLSTDSWSVGLSVSDPGVIIDGPSLSAMVSITVAAMAKGQSIPRRRVITGTVTSDGRIGPVGGVALKVLAAHQAGLQMILVPSAAASIEKTPGSSRIFKVGSVRQAYEALTSIQGSDAVSS